MQIRMLSWYVPACLCGTYSLLVTWHLQVQFFTWEATHPQMSWWKHFETEVPNLAAMGVTQVWLPPPNKAMRKVRGAFF